jgi:hypothetical protein
VDFYFAPCRGLRMRMVLVHVARCGSPLLRADKPRLTAGLWLQFEGDVFLLLSKFHRIYALPLDTPIESVNACKLVRNQVITG